MTYPALSLYVDKSACTDIDRMLFDFLWKHKRHYVKIRGITLKSLWLLIIMSVVV